MSIIYSIKAVFDIPTSVSPPLIVSQLFSAQPTQVVFDSTQLLVTFDAPQSPADLGPLVKVEQISK